MKKYLSLIPTAFLLAACDPPMIGMVNPTSQDRLTCQVYQDRMQGCICHFQEKGYEIEYLSNFSDETWNEWGLTRSKPYLLDCKNVKDK